MTLHDLAVRSMRIFIYGVMDWLDRGHGEASRIIATSYASKAVLREAAESMESRTIVFRAAALLGIRRRAYERHKHVACDVRDAVADAEQIAEVRGKAEPVPA